MRQPGADPRPSTLSVIDFSKPSTQPRLWVFDLASQRLLFEELVAHGRNTGHNMATKFSNRSGSKMSSLGLYVTQETYRFSGRSNGRAYTSVGLRMRGESGAYNSAARRRGIVAHGAPYVTARDAGRSSGCPAMEQHRAERLLPLIANGGVVFIYSPRVTSWLSDGPWVSGRAN